jgi:hypothetical protein
MVEPLRRQAWSSISKCTGHLFRTAIAPEVVLNYRTS